MDQTYATANSKKNPTTPNLQCTGYGFVIPASAVINSITVNVTRKSSSNNVSTDAVMKLLKSGATTGANRATSTPYTTADVTEAHGGSGDLWDTAWTPADINATNFGAAFAAISLGSQTVTVSVDYIEIVVDYSIPIACTPPSNAPTGVSCICDTFDRTNLNPSTIFGANWITSTSDSTGIVPRIVNPGYLRLTDNTGNNAKAVTVPGIFPAAGNYISVEFQQYAYGGTGADGMAVTLSDYSVPAVPGAFGGSLGYAQKSNPGSDCTKAGGCPGFAGGWIGVALDEYGNYQNPSEGRIGGPGATAQSVGVRGSGAGMMGYNWLAGTSTLSPTVDNSSSSMPAPGYTYQVVVDARAYPLSTAVQVNRNTGGGYSSLVNIPNVYATAAAQGFTQAPVPANWQISFTGSTGGSTNIHEIGAVQICTQAVYPPTGGTADGFSAIDEAYGNASASPSTVTIQNYLTGHIYMKLVGTPFKLNVAALTNNQVLSTYALTANKSVTVNLVDNSDGACVLDNTQANYCNAACKAKAAVPGGSQTLTFTSANKGQQLSGNFTVNAAYQKLAAVISDGTTSACSTDGFSVRPLGLTVASNANNSGTTGTPVFKASSSQFSLTATIPSANGGFSGYLNGVPKINPRVLAAAAPATVAGILTGTFSGAATGTPAATATGANFSYSEVGAFQLPGFDPAADTVSPRGVLDGVTTATECNGLSLAQCDGLRAATWSGIDSVSAKGDCNLDSYSNAKDANGKYGCNFGMTQSVTFGRFVPDHFALSAPALANRADLACSPVSVFTYMNEPMTARFTLTAQNAAGATTQNYTGALAKLDLSKPGNFSLGALGNMSLTSRLAPVSSSGNWLAGVAQDIPLTFTFSRAASVDGPFTPQFGIAPLDSDQVGLLPASYNLDIDPPAGANDHVLIGQASMRFGRLRLFNAFGSEKLDLPVPVEAQYWNGVAFITNADDSCTALSGANAVLGNYASGLSATNLGSTHLSGFGTLASGKLGLKLSKPAPAGSGSVDLAIDLGAGSSSDQSCPAPSLGSATGAGLDYLQSQWCGTDFTRDPRARIRFGVYKNANQMIYLREMY